MDRSGEEESNCAAFHLFGNHHRTENQAHQGCSELQGHQAEVHRQLWRIDHSSCGQGDARRNQGHQHADDEA